MGCWANTFGILEISWGSTPLGDRPVLGIDLLFGIFRFLRVGDGNARLLDLQGFQYHPISKSPGVSTYAPYAP